MSYLNHPLKLFASAKLKITNNQEQKSLTMPEQNLLQGLEQQLKAFEEQILEFMPSCSQLDFSRSLNRLLEMNTALENELHKCYRQHV